MLFVAAVVVSTAIAGCEKNRVDVSSETEFISALKNAKRGDEIVLAEGVYKNNYFFDISYIKEQEDCPVTITAEKMGTAIIDGWLKLTNVPYAVVSNLVFIDSNDYKQRAQSHLEFRDCHHSVAENIQFVNCSEPLSISSDNFVARNCSFDDFYFDALEIFDAKNVTVEKCVFGSDLGLGGEAAIYIDGAFETVIKDCVFECTDALVWIDYIKSNDNVVSGCTFKNTKKSIYRGVWTDLDCANNTYKENYMILDGFWSIGFAVGDTENRVCASNKYDGEGKLTDGPVDQSC